jgi:ferrous iron transport protein A
MMRLFHGGRRLGDLVGPFGCWLKSISTFSRNRFVPPGDVVPQKFQNHRGSVSPEHGCKHLFHRDNLRDFIPPLPNGSLPLTMVAPEKPVKLVEIMARGRLRHRLTELGLTPGVELKVLQNRGGPLLLAVHNTRLALGRD